jgi:hypothetical protein
MKRIKFKCIEEDCNAGCEVELNDIIDPDDGEVHFHPDMCVMYYAQSVDWEECEEHQTS